jgi:putative oxidoreductase
MPNRFVPQTFAFLRIISGLLFATHGSQKLFGWPGAPMGGHLPPLIVAAAVIELAGGLLIASGLFARAAAFVSSGQMAVAYFMAHASGGWNPVVNKGETAVLYCFLFLFFAAYGSGIWSLDALRTRGASASR